MPSGCQDALSRPDFVDWAMIHSRHRWDSLLHRFEPNCRHFLSELSRGCVDQLSGMSFECSCLKIETVNVYTIWWRSDDSLWSFVKDLKVERNFVDGYFVFPREVLLRASQKCLRKEETANPKCTRLSQVDPITEEFDSLCQIGHPRI
jgi:hypothetical protein